VAQNAKTAGFHRLYHYEKFSQDNLEDVLTKQRVHCSDLANLNDPWDCRPWFDAEALDDPKVLEEFIQWIFLFTPTSPVSDGERTGTQEVIRTDANYRRAVLARWSEDFIKMIPDRWRVYCLTPVPDSTLMWSHYTNNHKGICLEFGLENQLFGTAMEVEYVSSYPKWAPHLLEEAMGVRLLLTKSDDWRYEREYRIIGLAEGVSRPVGRLTGHPLSVRDGFLSLPKGALRAVIAGCEADYAAIKKLVQSIDGTITVRRAVRSPSKYHLEIAE
jgi:Protein of unknown function (DUF2971)